MDEVLKKLEELEINYELVKHPPVYTIEDMTNLDPAIFKGAEICKNLFLRDQKGKRHFLVILCGDKQASMDKIHPNTNEACILITFADLKKFLDDCGHEVEYITI